MVDISAKRDELTGVRFEATPDMAKASEVLLRHKQVPVEQAPGDPASGATGGVTDSGSEHLVPPHRLEVLQSTVWADLLD